MVSRQMVKLKKKKQSCLERILKTRMLHFGITRVCVDKLEFPNVEMFDFVMGLDVYDV